MWINHYLAGRCYRNQQRYPLDRIYWVFEQPRGPREIDIFPCFAGWPFWSIISKQLRISLITDVSFSFVNRPSLCFPVVVWYSAASLDGLWNIHHPQGIGWTYYRSPKATLEWNKAEGIVQSNWWIAMVRLLHGDTFSQLSYSLNFSLFLFQCCVCSVVFVSHHPYKKVSGIFFLL